MPLIMTATTLLGVKFLHEINPVSLKHGVKSSGLFIKLYSNDVFVSCSISTSSWTRLSPEKGLMLIFKDLSVAFDVYSSKKDLKTEKTLVCGNKSQLFELACPQLIKLKLKLIYSCF
jgi:hypothetical protein